MVQPERHMYFPYLVLGNKIDDLIRRKLQRVNIIRWKSYGRNVDVKLLFKYAGDVLALCAGINISSHTDRNMKWLI